MTSLRGLLVRGPLLVFAAVLGVLMVVAGLGLQRYAWRDASARGEVHLDPGDLPFPSEDAVSAWIAP